MSFPKYLGEGGVHRTFIRLRVESVFGQQLVNLCRCVSEIIFKKSAHWIRSAFNQTYPTGFHAARIWPHPVSSTVGLIRTPFIAMWASTQLRKSLRRQVCCYCQLGWTQITGCQVRLVWGGKQIMSRLNSLRILDMFIAITIGKTLPSTTQSPPPPPPHIYVYGERVCVWETVTERKKKKTDRHILGVGGRRRYNGNRVGVPFKHNLKRHVMSWYLNLLTGWMADGYTLFTLNDSVNIRTVPICRHLARVASSSPHNT